MHKTAEQHLAPEVARGHNNEWENDRCLSVSGGQPGEPLLLAHDTPPVTYDVVETFAEGTELVGLTVVERHALSVLTKTDEVETEVGLVALLVKVQPDQGAPDPIGKPGTREGIEERGPHKIAWQPEGKTGNGERPREAPENRDKRDQGHHGAHSANAESQRAGDKLGHVVGYALVGIVRLSGQQLHSIVGALRQPAPQVALGEPAAPANLEHLVEVDLVDGKDNVKTGEPGESNQLVEKDGVVLVLQGVVEGIVPLIEKDIDIDDREVEHDHGKQEPARCPAVLRGPVRMSH